MDSEVAEHNAKCGAFIQYIWRTFCRRRAVCLSFMSRRQWGDSGDMSAVASRAFYQGETQYAEGPSIALVMWSGLGRGVLAV